MVIVSIQVIVSFFLWSVRCDYYGYRHNSYLLECTGVRDTSYYYAIHDIKHLLLFFACEKSFSDDTGGGGRQSNAHLLPYLMHLALYTINTYVSMYTKYYLYKINCL